MNVQQKLLKLKLVLQEYPMKMEKMEIRGRDLLTGLPKTIEISSDEIAEALRESIAQIIDGVKKTLKQHLLNYLQM